jgi:phosphoribosyl-AMP cyclohydrolase
MEFDGTEGRVRPADDAGGARSGDCPVIASGGAGRGSSFRARGCCRCRRRAGRQRVPLRELTIGEVKAAMAAEGIVVRMTLDAGIASRLKRDANGLFTAVAQERGTGQVLMVAWMDDVALARTLETRKATYYSRSRQQHWVQGVRRPVHTQYVHSVRLDCDGDTVLLEVDQVGAACHAGDHSCFDADLLLGGPEA